jgi:hypothetical protein
VVWVRVFSSSPPFFIVCSLFSACCAYDPVFVFLFPPSLCPHPLCWYRNFLGVGMMPNVGVMGASRGGFGMQGHFNPAFMQNAQGAGGQFNAPDGPRKRYRTEESG